MTPVVVEPAAQGEIDRALAYSAWRYPKTVATFRAAVDAAVAAIAANPAVGAKVGRSGCREVILRRYPYRLIYREVPSGIQVIAFAHGKRRPGYWKRRLP